MLFLDEAPDITGIMSEARPVILLLEVVICLCMRDLNLLETLGAVVGGALALLMFIAQVSPEQAVSNTSRWLCSALAIQNPPPWLASPDANRVVRHGAQLGMALLLIAGVFLFVDVGKMLPGPKTLLIVCCIGVVASVAWHLVQGQAPTVPASAQAPPAVQTPTASTPATPPVVTPAELPTMVAPAPPTQPKGSIGGYSVGSVGTVFEDNYFEGVDTGFIVNNSIDTKIRGNVVTRGDIPISLPPPTGELASLSPAEIRHQARQLGEKMRAFEKAYKQKDDAVMSSNDYAQRNQKLSELSREKKADFIARFATESLALVSEIISRTGPIDLGPPASPSLRFGARVVQSGRLMGAKPVLAVADFLDYLAEKVPQ